MISTSGTWGGKGFQMYHDSNSWTAFGSATNKLTKQLLCVSKSSFWCAHKFFQNRWKIHKIKAFSSRSYMVPLVCKQLCLIESQLHIHRAKTLAAYADANRLHIPGFSCSVLGTLKGLLPADNRQVSYSSFKGIRTQREDPSWQEDGDGENMLLLHDAENRHIHGCSLQSGKT